MNKNSDLNHVSMSSIEPAAQLRVRKESDEFAYGESFIQPDQIEKLDDKEADINVTEIPTFKMKQGSNYGLDPSDSGSAFKGLAMSKQSMKQPQVKRQEYQNPKPIEKRKLLTKQQFDSDLHLQTGRFENEDHATPKDVAKSAAHAM